MDRKLYEMQAQNGSLLTSNKGIAFPEKVHPLPALTDKDKKDLAEALAMALPVNPEEAAASLHAATRTMLGRLADRAARGDPDAAPALATAWDHIRFIKRSMKHLDKQIAHFIDPIPNPIITVSGLGAVITAGLLAEIVDVSRFAEHKHLAQYAGITWEKRSSGNFVSQNTRLTKVGNKYLRYYFVMGANTLRRFNLEYKAFYWRKYNEVSKYRHKRALVLTARKLVRLVHALLTKNVPYVRPQALAGIEEVGSLQ